MWELYLSVVASTSIFFDKHAYVVKMPDRASNTTKTRSENRAKAKGLGKTVSPTCASILLSRKQAQPTEIDSRSITMNVEFKLKADNAAQNCRNCMASKKKFQHNEIVNHQDTGNQQKQSTSLTLSASQDSSKNLGRRISV